MRKMALILVWTYYINLCLLYSTNGLLGGNSHPRPIYFNTNKLQTHFKTKEGLYVYTK